MKRNGDVMRSDRLKQVMQEIDSSFDEAGECRFLLYRRKVSRRLPLLDGSETGGKLEPDLRTPG